MRANTFACRYRVLRTVALSLVALVCLVNSCLSAPKVYDVGTVLYEGRLWIVGTVDDPDEDSSGTTVFVEGDVTGTSTVFEDNMFRIMIPFSGAFGSGTVQTIGHDGEVSNIVDFEFYD